MKWLVGILAVCLASCAVVNVYVTFPEEKIRKAADDLLGPAEPARQGQSYLNIQFATPVYAEEVAVTRDLKTSSPVLDEVKKKRASWQEKITEYKKQGWVGESNQFSLVIKNTPPDAGNAVAVRELVDKENQQRNIMIEELMRINNADRNQEKTFREIFAETMIKNYTPAGAWVQLSSGAWVQK